jgi:hypothetical protein
MPDDFEIIGEITNIEEIEDRETEIPETKRFAICIRNADYEVSLTRLKVYPVIDDLAAEEDGMLRIIDESREDYLHTVERFIVLTLSPTHARELVKAMKRPSHDDSDS